MKWEKIQPAPDGAYELQRAAVPGGWLVHLTYLEDNVDALTFVPDAEHAWDPAKDE